MINFIFCRTISNINDDCNNNDCENNNEDNEDWSTLGGIK